MHYPARFMQCLGIEPRALREIVIVIPSTNKVSTPVHISQVASSNHIRLSMWNRNCQILSEMKVSERLSLHYILALAEKQKLGPQKVSHCYHSGLLEPWKCANDCEMGGMWNPGVLAWIIKEETVNGKP